MKKKIILTALSAKQLHKTLSVWCLKAYAEERVNDIDILVREFTINDRLSYIKDSLYQEKPDIIGFSCYIWNIEQVIKIAEMLKKLMPELIIILGGPEVSFETDIMIFPFADYIIKGTGEASFTELVENIGSGNRPTERIISGQQIDLSKLPTPYTANFFDTLEPGQLVYYESSRGCPFSCSYCLSSLTEGVDYLPLEQVFHDLMLFSNKKIGCVKFVDRTFNANKKRANEILNFIKNMDTETTFHFEAAGDLFDEKMLGIIAAMPVKRVQFEIGIQSLNDNSLCAVNRKTDLDKVLDNIKKLVKFGNCHIHIDLIAGLPFENMESFTVGVDMCLALNTNMLQLGFLKLLKGSEIRKNADKYSYIYNAYPPYEVFQNEFLSADEIIKLGKIESLIDKYYNTGMARETISFAVEKYFKSGYYFFEKLAEFSEAKINMKLSLKNTYTLLYTFLLRFFDETEAAHYIKLDCLSFDSKGILPAGIAINRDKKLECTLKTKGDNIRAEIFDFDGKTRIFNYDKRNPITNKFPCYIFQE